MCVYFHGAVCLDEDEHINCTWAQTKTSDLRPPERCLAPLPNRLSGGLIAARDGLDCSEPSMLFNLDCEQPAKLTYEAQTEKPCVLFQFFKKENDTFTKNNNNNQDNRIFCNNFT